MTADDLWEPEAFWGAMLSEDAERIRAAWISLPEGERSLVRAHLRKMISGEGWHPDQRKAAVAALKQAEEKQDPV